MVRTSAWLMPPGGAWPDSGAAVLAADAAAARSVAVARRLRTLRRTFARARAAALEKFICRQHCLASRGIQRPQMRGSYERPLLRRDRCRRGRGFRLLARAAQRPLLDREHGDQAE